MFDDDRYFDVFVEYAKVDAEDLLMRITVDNRGPEAAPLHVLPTVWFRNTWSWNGETEQAVAAQPAVRDARPVATLGRRGAHATLRPPLALLRRRPPELLFTENETNTRRLFGVDNGRRRFAKDGINDYIVHGARDAVNPARTGTKAAAHYALTVPAGGTVTVRVRFSPHGPERTRHRRAVRAPFDARCVAQRQARSRRVLRHASSRRRSRPTPRSVMRQSLAGMLWSKQFYPLRRQGLARRRSGAAGAAAPSASSGRNHEWPHLYNADVISMPDKWEYPWYAAWDLAFHCVPLALVDSEFAKDAARADAARVVHAPERAASRLRVGVRRRQSAGARLGGVARLQDREEAARRRRSRCSSNASSRSCCSTSPGG